MPTVNEFRMDIAGNVTTEYSDGTVTTGSVVPASTLTAEDVVRVRALEAANAVSVRAVATRGSICSAAAPANKQTMSRSRHVMQSDADWLQIVLPGWYSYGGTGIDTNAPGAASYSCSIEYPVGVVTRATFSGAFVGTCATGGELVSDAVAVKIPRGAAFYVRVFQDAPSGIIYSSSYKSTAQGEWCAFGVSVTDRTADATNSADTQTGVSFRPLAIIGESARPSYGLVMDSRGGIGAGYDQIMSSNGGNGEAERALAWQVATINCGRPGETAAAWASGANVAKRRSLVQRYCTHAHINLGINDCTAAASAATTAANLLTAARSIGLPAYWATLSPKSASTDGWVSTGNQTTDAAVNPLRVALNALGRAGFAAPYIGTLEVADQVESARDSGIWKAGYTSDGLHASGVGGAAIEASTAFARVLT